MKKQYPRLPYNMNRNRKLMDWQDAEVKKLYQEGYSLHKLAKIFGVSRITIKRHVNPEFKEQDRIKQQLWNKIYAEQMTPLEKEQNAKYIRKIKTENENRYQPQKQYSRFHSNLAHSKSQARKNYTKQYYKDFKATHKYISNNKWVLVDGLKWRILREMVIRTY